MLSEKILFQKSSMVFLLPSPTPPGLAKDHKKYGFFFRNPSLSWEFSHPAMNGRNVPEKSGRWHGASRTRRYFVAILRRTNHCQTESFHWSHVNTRKTTQAEKVPNRDHFQLLSSNLLFRGPHFGKSYVKKNVHSVCMYIVFSYEKTCVIDH